jgi:hypothetical protein
MDRIRSTSSKLPGMDYTDKYGSGLVNAYNAVGASN